MKIKNLTRKQHDEEKLTLQKLVQYRYENANRFQEVEDDLEGEVRGLKIKLGKSEEYIHSDSIKAEFVTDSISAKQIVREQFLKEVSKYGLSESLFSTKNTVKFLAPDYETCSKDNFVCPDRKGKQNGTETQKMNSCRSISENKWTIAQPNVGKVTINGEMAFIEDRRQVFKLNILIPDDYGYEQRDLCLTEEIYYPIYDEDAEMYEVPILDNYLIGRQEYSAFWPLHPDLRQSYAELLTLKKVHQVYDSIKDRVNLTVYSIQQDFGVELGVLLFKYLGVEEMRKIEKKQFLKERMLDIIHENMHKEKRKLIITIINKVKDRRKLSIQFTNLYQSDEEYDLGQFVRPEIRRLSDFMLMGQIPIFNIRRQPLIWVYYQRAKGVLIPISYFIETQQFNNIFENAQDQFQWRCCDILCQRLEHPMGSNLFKAYVKIFIFLREHWKGLMKYFEKRDQEKREALRIEEERKKQQEYQKFWREKFQQKKFIIQEEQKLQGKMKEETEKYEEKKSWLGRWTTYLKSKLLTFRFLLK